jgi:hypothetical protein
MSLRQQLAEARFAALEAARWNNEKMARHYRDLADSLAEQLISRGKAA